MERSGRPCKVCGCKEIHPEAYNMINKVILEGKRGVIKALIEEVNMTYNLSLNAMNISRHRKHLNDFQSRVDSKGTQYSTTAEIAAQNQSQLADEYLPVVADMNVTNSQMLFLLRYIETGMQNAKQVSIEMGRDPTYGSILLAKPHINACIARILAKRTVQANNNADVALSYIQNIATSNIRDFIDENGELKCNLGDLHPNLTCAISEIVQKKNHKTGEIRTTLKLKSTDKMLELWFKWTELQKMADQEKLNNEKDITNEVTVEKLSDEERLAQLKDVIVKLKSEGVQIGI
jgi:hypothetical protein